MSLPLNPEQRAAVRHVEGPLLVLAGAGSGKTRVIAAKIAHLVQGGIDPARIAAITFTNKAAGEMRERAAGLMGREAAAPLTVCTFHALGLRILRAEGHALGLKPRFSILDPDDVEGIMADVVRSTDRARVRAALARVSRWKNALVEPGAALARAGDEDALAGARAYVAYVETLSAYQAVDFDDLRRLPVRLLETGPEAGARWRERFGYVLVDEYQDTNLAQYRMLRALTAGRDAFTVVGDDDQAIYGWRGASADNLARLKEDYPRLTVVKLERNYRSSTRILRSANRLIANNAKLFDKRLWSELGPGDPIQVFAARDDEHEAETVVRRLLAHRFEHRGRLADYAVLYRGNHQARAFERELRAQGTPYVVSGGTSMFDRTEIKDLLAWLRLLVNDSDDPAFIRAVTTPKRGVGPQTLEKLGRAAGERKASLFETVYDPALAASLPERSLAPLRAFCDLVGSLRYRAERERAAALLPELLKRMDYERHLHDAYDERQALTKWASVRDFCDWLARRGEEEGKPLLEVAQAAAILSMLDEGEGRERDAVRLSTVHAAKGLEFPHVFVVGLEEGLLPHRESVEAGGVEEERRLFYVALTRAQKSVHLSWCRKRRRARDFADCAPSRFIAELAQEDLRHAGGQATPEEAASEKAAGAARLAALREMLRR